MGRELGFSPDDKTLLVAQLMYPVSSRMYTLTAYDSATRFRADVEPAI